MPSHRVHKLIDRLILGRSYGRVHRYMDSLSFLGPWHRFLPPHDPFSLLIHAENPQEIFSGLMHISTDILSSELRKRMRMYGKRR
ncbi:MAG: hypothetical protein MRT15_04205 [archaeon YNP-LCB-003-016]|uniref:hypothetical protein n=1 Tax=Candidatus Culexarchaeum yellowstonense TaxID=2928963 RepID=UPI0026F1C4AB|nr:hypothetical protein [Candidatus Culexarchaeum yellowstonense]MCR6691571.1 hypothetical protein [Candidatus Culexarchaeum yellowstonense]